MLLKLKYGDAFTQLCCFFLHSEGSAAEDDGSLSEIDRDEIDEIVIPPGKSSLLRCCLTDTMCTKSEMIQNFPYVIQYANLIPHI